MFAKRKRLSPNSEIDDGSEVAKLMDYFKTADPEDMSQGDLSARIHLMSYNSGCPEVW